MWTSPKIIALCLVCFQQTLSCPILDAALARRRSGESLGLSVSDLQRAHQPRPGASSHVHGESAAEAFAKMNLVLLADSVRTAPCDGFTHEDLNGAARVLYALRNAELDRGFQSRADRHGRI